MVKNDDKLKIKHFINISKNKKVRFSIIMIIVTIITVE